MDAKCVKAEVKSATSMFDDSYVKAVMDDGSEVKMQFYSDEISFSPDEIVGRTEQEMYNLKGEKDRAYLRA